MLILGIETSCDETAAALLSMEQSGQAQIITEEISSQADIHAAYGGVVPELAAREHLQSLPLIVDSVLNRAKCDLAKIDVIAVTQGPGLKGCLLMGLGFAKGLALAHAKPLIGVNHIEGHILAVCLDNPELKFPYLSLVVSGGHTEIHLVRGVGEYELMARSLDDAAGEAFDKSAALLSLPYPGGPRLAALADQARAGGFEVEYLKRFPLPKVMRSGPGFSFSGLKTAIALLLKREADAICNDERAISLVAGAIQTAIVDALVFKLEEAIHQSGLKSVSITGGVSANLYLRERVKKIPGIQVFLPSSLHCMDNAGMIAYVGGLRYLRGERLAPQAEVQSRWPVETL